MVTQPLFLARLFRIFDFWTFFLSIFENPKILCSKNIEKREKYNKSEKGLKESKYNKSEKGLKEHFKISQYILLWRPF